MPQSDRQTQFQEAIQLAQAGQRSEARWVLEAIVRADPNNALAWLWLATVATEREERIQFLERALALEPANARAQEAYAQLTGATFVSPQLPPVAIDAPNRVERIAPSTVNLFVAIAAAGVIVIAALLVLGAFQSGGDAETPIPLQASLTPSNTPGPLPTATWTPLPSHTPGPSPTSIWEAPLPTWTPVLTRTPLPAATLRLSQTATQASLPGMTQTAAVALTSDGAAQDDASD